MSFDFSTLVTDRTQADVNRVKQIAEKIKNGTASESELAEFNGAAMKGAYNYTDLNRVTAAMEALKAKLEGYGYAVPGYQKIKIPHPSAGGGSRLPEGYTELTYIESTGTQYVNTGFKPNQDTRVVLDVEITGENESLAANDIFGCRTSTSSKAYAVQWNTANNYFQHFYNDGLDNLTFGDFSRQIMEMNKNVLLLGGVSHTRTYKSFQCDYAMYLFALNNAGTAAFFSKMRVYSCQIYDKGTLVRDYVPCRTPSGEVGLYDLVTKQFYGNSGAGSFVAGEEIAPPADNPIVEEYDPYLWYEFDLPTVEQMEQYLTNVDEVRTAFTMLSTTPATPASMELLTWAKANHIEQILADVEILLTVMSHVYLRSGMTWAYSGGSNFYFMN